MGHITARTHDVGRNPQGIEKELESVLRRVGPGCCNLAGRAEGAV